MSRRVSLPGADELFRPTSETAEEPLEHVSETVEKPTLAAAPDPVPAPEAALPVVSPDPDLEATTGPARRSSGRVRHDEKMTVYVTADELIEIEHARLVLRRTVGAVDRGRLVRAAVAMALADLDEYGGDSELLRRLRES